PQHLAHPTFGNLDARTNQSLVQLRFGQVRLLAQPTAQARLHLGTVRWDRVAEGLGCQPFYADRMEDLEAALKGAKASDGPAVVCLKTNRDANLAIPAELGRSEER